MKLNKGILVCSVGDIPYAISICRTQNNKNENAVILYRSDIIKKEYLAFLECKLISYSLNPPRFNDLKEISDRLDSITVFSFGFDAAIGLMLRKFKRKKIFFYDVYSNLYTNEIMFRTIKLIPFRALKSIYWFFFTGVFFTNYDSVRKKVFHFYSHYERINLTPTLYFKRLSIPDRTVVFIEEENFYFSEEIKTIFEKFHVNIRIKRDPRLGYNSTYSYLNLPDLPIEFLDLSKAIGAIGKRSRAIGIINSITSLSVLNNECKDFWYMKKYLTTLNSKLIFNEKEHSLIVQVENYLKKISTQNNNAPIDSNG